MSLNTSFQSNLMRSTNSQLVFHSELPRLSIHRASKGPYETAKVSIKNHQSLKRHLPRTQQRKSIYHSEKNHYIPRPTRPPSIYPISRCTSRNINTHHELLWPRKQRGRSTTRGFSKLTMYLIARRRGNK